MTSLLVWQIWTILNGYQRLVHNKLLSNRPDSTHCQRDYFKKTEACCLGQTNLSLSICLTHMANPSSIPLSIVPVPGTWDTRSILNPTSNWNFQSTYWLQDKQPQLLPVLYSMDSLYFRTMSRSALFPFRTMTSLRITSNHVLKLSSNHVSFEPCPTTPQFLSLFGISVPFGKWSEISFRDSRQRF